MSECALGGIEYQRLLEVSKVYIERHKGSRRRRRGIGYGEALVQVQQAWHEADLASIAGAIKQFLLNYNRALYWSERSLDDAAILACVKKAHDSICSYQHRTIASFDAVNETDTEHIRWLFGEFLQGTQHAINRKHSPVSVGKTLSILAPEFFPLWDNGIARGYECHWGRGEAADGCYLRFMGKIQQCFTVVLESYTSEKGVSDNQALAAICEEAGKWHGYRPTLLKLIDENNMEKFSGGR
jgi:hypothetical protein